MKQAHWWQSAIVYQIYPRSFQDSNGDGIGDLPGIISRLDYLAELGIEALWLSPVYASPNDDNGYDISDYRAIMPEFGTMADMDKLIVEAKKRNIRLIMDLVVNHTSDEHPWFQAAQKSKDNPYRDYYIWADGQGDLPPNDLTSVFSGSAWEYQAATEQYYLHMFSKKQPDLNWKNPQVRAEIYDMMNFWLAKGIGGFRLDVIDQIGKEPFRKIINNGPQLHAYLQEMNRETFGKYDVMTVGETWGATPEIAKLYSNPKRHEFSMVFQFETMEVDQVPGKEKWDSRPFDVPQLKNILAKWQTTLGDEGWNSLFWNNHDLPRVISRFGAEGILREKSGKCLAILLHLMKGTPYIYQGEEIGMVNRQVNSLAEVADIESLNMAQERLARGFTMAEVLAMINRMGRDTARSPFLWNDQLQAGFTTGTPWLSITQDYLTINAQRALEQPDSIFYTYQQLIALRKAWPLVVWGDFTLLASAPNVFAYERSYQGETLLIVANLSKEAAVFTLPRAVERVVITNRSALNDHQLELHLAPYDALAVVLEPV